MCGEVVSEEFLQILQTKKSSYEKIVKCKK